ncbi:hypothetical protein A8950_1953 [Dongia mobilis]|uniref:DUF1150 family protein n=1 Tax=Dongia mobilis TaxID=578943 RepID=A0A4R6WMD1_9PROT|nr:DUF1150 family protein [Dongia mobilis]TDQ82132.1 hypothetical protein A8950_1953 [Dongia mobilis]
MANKIDTRQAVHAISAQQLAALGLNNLAYVKETEIDGGTAFAIFAANGERLAIVPDRETAIAAAWENGLAPVTLH